MSNTPLRDRSKQELSTLARRRGISDYDTMTKDALVKALNQDTAKAAPAGKAKTATNGTPRPPAKPAAPARPKAKPAAAAKRATAPASPPKARGKAPPKPIRPEPAPIVDKNIVSKAAKAGGNVKDQIVLTVPDPYWLHAYWQLSLQSIQRAEAALGQDWHGAIPILRVFDVTSQDTTSTSEAPIRDISIHGGCSHWYIDIPQPPRSYRVDVGYRTRTGRFFPLSRSNVVAPPAAGASESLDENWTSEVEDKVADRFLAAAAAAEAGHVPRDSDEPPFRRTDTPFGPGAAAVPGKLKKFFFDIEAQLIVVGRTDPAATVTLNNEHVPLNPDGTFAQRYSLPDSRQIIPAVATSADGMEEQTIVLAVERNTKRLDPMLHDLYGDS